MKSFAILRTTMVLAGVTGVLWLAPQCRAQAEINPDHFDGTDSWATPAKSKPGTAKQLPTEKPAATKSSRSGNATVQPVAAREKSTARREQPVVVPRKRNSDTSKTNQ